MHKGAILAISLAVLLGACASDKHTVQAATAGQKQASTGTGTSQSQNEEPASVNAEVQDKQIMDLSKIDSTEEAGWIDPKNPPEMKRKYQKGAFSVVLPEDMYPVTTSVYPSAGLFRFKNADAYMYLFAPASPAASALLDINLNALDLSRQKGYHDMVIDLKGSILRVTYRFDGANDGYVRYVDVKKAYQPPGMLISALLVKDPQGYAQLQQKYRSVLGTVKSTAN
jgi:hypothetical protein